MFSSAANYPQTARISRSIARDRLASESGWSREQGKGRFVYLAPGHTPEAPGHPMMQRLMRNSVNWLLRLGDK